MTKMKYRDALRAALNGPKHICVDSQDNILIADTDNHLIRKFLPKENKVIRIAGGSADEFTLNQPHGVQVDQSGNIYIADSLNNRVLRLTN